MTLLFKFCGILRISELYKPGPWQSSILVKQWYKTCKHEMHRPSHQNYEIDINKHHHDCNTYADSSEKTNKLFLSLSFSNKKNLLFRRKVGFNGSLKFGHSEKDTKFEKIFHLKGVFSKPSGKCIVAPFFCC